MDTRDLGICATEQRMHTGACAGAVCQRTMGDYVLHVTRYHPPHYEEKPQATLLYIWLNAETHSTQRSSLIEHYEPVRTRRRTS